MGYPLLINSDLTHWRRQRRRRRQLKTEKLIFFFKISQLFDPFCFGIGVKNCLQLNAKKRCSVPKRNMKNFAIAVHVPQRPPNLVISRCCFAEDGTEICPKLFARAQPLSFSLTFCFTTFSLPSPSWFSGVRSLIISAGRLIMTRMLKTRRVFTHWADSNTRDRQHCPLSKFKHFKLKNEKMERNHLKPKPTLQSQQVWDESRYTIICWARE